MQPIIEVRHLSKRYKLGAIGATSLREEVSRLFRKPAPTPKSPDFYALNDVSFEVQRGEVLGIIGRNGAGKSTLLKILSRITQQTRGEIILRGRVASLLEVGTGFHPELSGRDNIFLNGAILGMRKAEIRAKFDEIVAFAEVDRFIDIPVKRYSSGMYVRLAFAVAAHLEPEILVVDEVLAVGDAQFQKKCLGKMQDVASRGGRTVLFVSHNLTAVGSLCHRALWIDRGSVAGMGGVQETVAAYLQSGQNLLGGEASLESAPRGGGDQVLRFTRVRIVNSRSRVTAQIEPLEPFTLEIEFTVAQTLRGEIGMIVYSQDQTPLIRSSTDDSGRILEFSPGSHTIACALDPNRLRPGLYTILVGSTCGTLRDIVPEAIRFEVAETRPISKSTMHGSPGYVHFDFAWRFDRQAVAALS